MFSARHDDHTITLRAPLGAPVLRYVRDRLPEGEKSPSVEGGAYTHPVYTPSGEVVTDLAPADHPHHRGVFCGWVQLDGERSGDWWGWGAKAPKEGRVILDRETRVTDESPERVVLRAINSWRAEDETVLRERVTITARQAFGCNIVDYEYKFTPATRKPVVIARNPFGGFCYRAKPRGRLEVTGPEGEVQRADAVFDKPETNWPASGWYDMTYYTPDGKVNGVAVMDHPSNPLSTWHVVRGIHMQNPCIVADAPVTIPFGEPLYLRYRLVAHDGDAKSVDLPKLFDQFAETQ